MTPEKFPALVLRLAHNFDAWVVGSAALNGPSARDIDILVPWHQWHAACLAIPSLARPNSFGGWKFHDAESARDIDMWPGDLSWLAVRPKFRAALHIASGTLVIRQDSAIQHKDTTP